MGGVNRLEWGDLVVIAAYFLVTIAIGVWTIVKTKGTINGVFLAGRSMTWWPIGLSIFASNIGSINFIGIAGSAAASGVGVIHFEWDAVPLLLLLGWVFLPIYITSGIYTIPEYLQKRFGGKRLRLYLSVIAMVTYLFAILSVDLYSGALFIQQTLGWNLYAAVVALLAITFLFTGLGGLRTVILTDAIAVCVMVGGGFVLFVVGMLRVGGLANLRMRYMEAVPNITLPNTTCGQPRADSWHTFRDIGMADYPWLGTILRVVGGALWYFCANQVIVQRGLAAKNITHAKAGCVLACFIKFTPMVIMVLPGMISRALFPDEVACATPERCLEVCGNPAGCSNIAYPKLVTELLPHGLRGLLIAAIIAAVVSSLTSIFNSCSALFTMDIWTRIRPQASERELLIVGKFCVLILVVFSMVWIPTMEQAEGGQIYRYAITANGYFGGPTCAMFALAVVWPRINEQGAFWGMVCGQVWGILRFSLDLIFKQPLCGQPDERPLFMIYFHPFYHITSQLLLVVIVSAVISYLTKPLPQEQLAGVTIWTRKQIPANLKENSGNKADSIANEMLLKTISNGNDIETKQYSLETISNGDDIEKKQGCLKTNSDDDAIKTKQSFLKTKSDADGTKKEQGTKKIDKENQARIKEGSRDSIKKVLLSLVGMSGMASDTGQYKNVQTLEEYKARMARVEQPRWSRLLLNSFAMLCLAIMVSLHAYFF